MNNIEKLQDEEEQLVFMRARQQSFLHARLLSSIQMLLALGLPVGSVIVATWFPQFKAHVAAGALAAIMLDTLILDRVYRSAIKRAARLSEEFDCRVLSLPWDDFAAPERVEPEDVRSLSNGYKRWWRSDKRIRGWYPKNVGELPLHLGRIVCQRDNIAYDSALRRSYAKIILGVAILLVVGFAAYGLMIDPTMTQFVLTFAPATPFASWAAKEYYRQVDAAAVLDGLKKHTRTTWKKALIDQCGLDECLSISRDLQTALLQYRSSAPLVFPFLYLWKRPQLEDLHQAVADDFLKEYKQSLDEGDAGTR